MKKLLLPIVAIAMVMLPAAADAAQCRNSATGKFAKCGTPGAVPASQYVAKGKTTKAAPRTVAATAATPAKPSLLSKLKAKTTPAAKTARCKTATGKFVKCGTPGAKPA